MDNDLLYITVAANKKYKEIYINPRCNYNPVADVYREAQYELDSDLVGSINTSSTYLDSGGW